MNLTQAIRNRISVRSYSQEPLATEVKEKITAYVNALPMPLKGLARIEFINADSFSEPVKLGTYGVISGAKDFMLLISPSGTQEEINAGYLFEQAVLYCTSLGIGTCWLGGTLKKENFGQTVKIGENEELKIVSPIGYPALKPKFFDTIMRAGAGSAKRKPFGTLFFDGNFGAELSEKAAGVFGLPLEMMRLAPSSGNSQPWRAVVDEAGVHLFFEDKSRFSAIDMGIGVSHFIETCKQESISGGLKSLEQHPESEKATYFGSWVRG